MGTYTIIDILKSGYLPKNIIISSNNDLYTLRCYLNSINYKIIKEIVIYENGKYYDIISYEKGQEKLSYYQKLYGKSNDKKYFKYLLHKETYIFKKSKNFKTLKNIGLLIRLLSIVVFIVENFLLVSFSLEPLFKVFSIFGKFLAPRIIGFTLS